MQIVAWLRGGFDADCTLASRIPRGVNTKQLVESRFLHFIDGKHNCSHAFEENLLGYTVKLFLQYRTI